MARSPAKPERRRPRQERSRATVDAIVEAAARVFRREGWRATTNRIADEAGVSVGSLYEYFPSKQALLVALAERHIELAERHVALALRENASPRSLLAALQAAVVQSQQFPSQALELISGALKPRLGARAASLRSSALDGLTQAMLERGHAPHVASLRARAAFGAVGELSVLAWLKDPDGWAALGAELLEMAARHCEAPARPPEVSPEPPSSDAEGERSTSLP